MGLGGGHPRLRPRSRPRPCNRCRPEHARVLDAAAAALLLDPEFVEIARDELARAAAEIEGVMEGWGFYEDPAHFADNPDARLTGDPRDEWDCGAPS